MNKNKDKNKNITQSDSEKYLNGFKGDKEIMEQLKEIVGMDIPHEYPKASRQFTRDGLIEIEDKDNVVIGDNREIKKVRK